MRSYFTAALAAFVIVGMASTTSAYAAQINVPAGTKVQVRLVHPLSSGTATPNEQFAFEAAGPVLVNSHVVIARGALGSGHVVSVSKAQGKSAGKMALAFDTIHAVNGAAIALTEDSRVKGNSEKGKASTATIAATIALGPLGLFAHNMVKGKDVTVEPSRTFSTWVKSTTTVAAQ